MTEAQTPATSNLQLSPNDASTGRRRNSLVADLSFESTSQKTERRGSLNSQLSTQSHTKTPMDDGLVAPLRTNLDSKSPALLTRRMSKSFSNLMAFHSMRQESAPQAIDPLTTVNLQQSASFIINSDRDVEVLLDLQMSTASRTKNIQPQRDQQKSFAKRLFGERKVLTLARTRLACKMFNEEMENQK